MTSRCLSSIRKQIRLGVATIFRNLGVRRLEGLFSCPPGNLILAFHRVVRDCEVGDLLDPRSYVTECVFRELLLSLRRPYDFVPLSELVDRVTSGMKTCKPLCAVTFDDGYMDNYTNAFPILKELQMPATIFLTAGLIGTEKLLWNDAVSIAFLKQSKSPYAKDQFNQLLFANGLPGIASQRSEEARNSAGVRRLIEQLKTWCHARIEAFLSAVQGLVPCDQAEAQPFRLLTWDQAGEMTAHGIHFGSHTLSHCILTVEDEKTVQLDVEQSKALIESKIGMSIDAIAYPNGECNAQVACIARQAGFRIGLTLQKGYVSARSDPLRLSRLLINQQDIASPNGRFSPSLFEYEKSVLVMYAKRVLTSLLVHRGERKRQNQNTVYNRLH